MAESVEQQFPHQELTPLAITDKPTNASLRPLRKELNANAMSIPSVRGGGAHGHLSLTMPAAAYTALTGAVFVTPVHPGPAPIHVLGATQAQITETNRQYSANLKEFSTYIAVEANLKKLLIQAVPNVFIDELNNELFGYANTTTLALLTHLTTTYGTITSDDLNSNLDDLSRTWTSTQPLEDLWKQIRHCRLFAEDHDPISEAMAVRSAVQNLENSGVFIDAIKDWRKRPEAEHTFALLKEHFNTADRERLRLLTSSSAGYLAQALAATEIVADPAPPKPRKPMTLHYCWSHGLGPNPTHTSATCRRQITGHRTDSVLTNMLGGCNIIHRRRGERAVFVPTPEADPILA
jgi:hypothetical protein